VMGGMEGALAGDVGGVTRKTLARYRRIGQTASFKAKMEQ
jgi:hypothetical protein